MDSILATFGMAFILVGTMVLIYPELFAYSFLAVPVDVAGTTVAANRLVAFGGAVAISLALYLWLNRSNAGLAVRAVAVSPMAAGLVGINVERISALAFAIGGTITAMGAC